MIEVLVVCAIMVLLAGMLMAGYVRFNRKRQVEEAALNFATFLQDQQKRANSGDLVECSVGEKLEGYAVSITSAPTSVAATVANCSGALPSTYELINDTEFVENMAVKFLPLSRGVDLTKGDTKITKYGYIYIVNVDTNGSITVAEGP